LAFTVQISTYKRPEKINRIKPIPKNKESKNPSLEAERVQRGLTLLTHVDSLHVLLPLEEALLAVAPLRFAGSIQLCADNQVLHAVKPGLCLRPGHAGSLSEKKIMLVTQNL
jgi:hypothetical protein